MTDILIRMEMPKTCSQCPMCYDYMMCKLNHFAFWNTNEPFDCCDERLAGCPLVELPEHGDLIDRSALMKEHAKAESAKYGNLFVAGDNRFIHRFLEAPVVVPAERSGE